MAGVKARVRRRLLSDVGSGNGQRREMPSVVANGAEANGKARRSSNTKKKKKKKKKESIPWLKVGPLSPSRSLELDLALLQSGGGRNP
jgi:hypothetical protein